MNKVTSLYKAVILHWHKNRFIGGPLLDSKLLPPLPTTVYVPWTFNAGRVHVAFASLVDSRQIVMYGTWYDFVPCEYSLYDGLYSYHIM